MHIIRMKFKQRQLFRFLTGCLICVEAFLSGVAATPAMGQAGDLERIGLIDAHAHLSPRSRKGQPWFSDYERATETALTIMNSLSIRKSLIMPQPFPPEHPFKYDYKELAGILKKHPGRFSLLGGGGTLNPIIHESVQSGQFTQETRRLFEEVAAQIIRDGAVGFGELAAEHLSFDADHPYESAPPDHSLFLLLADIAARHHVPVDIHMEAVPQQMPLPSGLSSPRNPKTLRENISVFERLLSHNRSAIIVWAHAGWDNTGQRTVALMRRLLQIHPNLYMSMKVDPRSPPENHPLKDGKIRPEWLDLIQSFPDRIFIGGDQHYGVTEFTGRGRGRSKAARVFLDQLPPDLAGKVGYENAIRIYKLK